MSSPGILEQNIQRLLARSYVRIDPGDAFRQRLAAVLEERARSGRILGKGTPELESYRFQGKVYASGARPRLEREYFESVPFKAEAYEED